MANTLNDQALALTAVLQAASLVHSIATENRADESACETLIHSLFEFNPDSTADVYGQHPSFTIGKNGVLNMLGSKSSDASRQSIMNYCAGILRLAEQLQKDGEMMEAVGQRLKHAQRMIDGFADSVGHQYASIAGIYTDTLSKLPYRISVSGNEDYLKNRANADKIRSILFAGVRSAILWRQCGGKRRHFIFKRNALINAIKQL